VISDVTEQQTTTAPDRTGTVGSYVYGIVRAGERIPDDLVGVRGGDGEGGLGLVTHERVAAVVSDVPTDKALGTRKDLMAHEQVLNAIAERTAVLPMRFGGVVADDDAVADELLSQHEDYFAWALDQVEGKAQFTLRGTYVEDALMSRIVESDPEIQRLSESIRGVDEDASYYDRIKLGESISQAMDAIREHDTDEVLETLEPYVVATSAQQVGGDYGAVHVAILVNRDHRTDFERVVDELGDRWAGRVELRLVGPVAPFDFVPEMPDADPEAGA
jgi:hypothetical protein